MMKDILIYISHFGFKLFLLKSLLKVKNMIPTSIFRTVVSLKHKIIKRQIRKIIGDYKDFKLPDNPVCNQQNIIWFCWLQGKDSMPPIVQASYKSVLRNAKDYEIKFISLNNYANYVNLPNYILKLYNIGKLKKAHFADILRTYLLYYHGGLWIDSTIFVEKKIPLYNEFDFYSLRLKPDIIYVSQCRWCNCFLFSKPRDRVMGNVLKMFYLYLKKEFVFIDYFMMDYFIALLYDDSTEIRKVIDAIPKYEENMYAMDSLLNMPYIKCKAELENIPFSKLHWNGNFLLQADGQDTVFNYIMEHNEN